MRIRMPELGLVEFIQGYSGNDAVTATMHSHFDFQGLIGLPVLRLIECGGNGSDFWIRSAP